MRTRVEPTGLGGHPGPFGCQCGLRPHPFTVGDVSGSTCVGVNALVYMCVRVGACVCVRLCVSICVYAKYVCTRVSGCKCIKLCVPVYQVHAYLTIYSTL